MTKWLIVRVSFEAPLLNRGERFSVFVVKATRIKNQNVLNETTCVIRESGRLKIDFHIELVPECLGYL